MGRRSGAIKPFLQALYALFIFAFISACEVEFEPQIEPLILATLPAKPFSGSASIDAEITPVSPSVSPIEPVLEEINIAGVIGNLPKLLILVSGASGFLTLILGAFVLFGKREGIRPSTAILIVVAILLTITTLLIELLFIAAEVILVISGLVQSIPGLLLSLLLPGLGLFIGNFELAFVIYVYRVASARPGEKVPFKLWPWEAWGLSEGEERE